MGLAVGMPGDATCAPLAGASTITQAGTAAQLSGTTSAATLCVQVYDLVTSTCTTLGDTRRTSACTESLNCVSASVGLVG